MFTFVNAGRDHIVFEETKVWPPLRRTLTEDEAVRLGDQIAEGKRTAPTRPHPNTP